MTVTIDAEHAASVRAQFATALATGCQAVVKPDFALSTGGMFPNAFAVTSSLRCEDRCGPLDTLEGEWVEGVEAIEPEPFDATDTRWSRSYKAPKINLAHLPIGGFTNAALVKLDKADKAYLHSHPIVLDRSHTLPAPVVSAVFAALIARPTGERFNTPGRIRAELWKQWHKIQNDAAPCGQQTWNYRTLDAKKLTDYGFTSDSPASITSAN